MPEPSANGWMRMLAEAGGLSAACFIVVLVLGGNGPGEAAVAALAVAGSPNPAGSRPLHADIGQLISASRLALTGWLRQDSPAARRTAA